MDRSVALPVALPGLRAVRATTESLSTKMKEHFGVGRIEEGHTEWWGGGRVWRSSPGTVLLKQPGDVVRHLSHQGPTTFVAVTFPAADVAQVRSEGQAVAVPQLDAGDGRAAPFHRLLGAISGGADRLTLEVSLAEAVGALVALGRVTPDHTLPVRRAMECLRERLDQPVTLDDLAAHAGLDKFHLCRAFRAQVGLPPHAYLTHLRIARAKALLQRGVRASDVAPLVGFYDQAQFTRHFRRFMGTTPARFGKAPTHTGPLGVLRCVEP